MTGPGEKRGSTIATTAEELSLLVAAVEDYAIFLLSPTGEIRTWNSGAERTFGYRAEEALGKNFAMFYPPADLAAEKPRHELEVAGRDGRIEDEGWRLRNGGEHFWANTVITAVRDALSRIGPSGGGGGAVVSDAEFEASVREVDDVRRLLLGLVQGDGWKWEDVYRQ